MAAVAAAAVAVGGSYLQSKKQREAAGQASQAETEASRAGIEEQRRQFDKIQELLQPYVQAGTGAIEQQQALLGIAPQKGEFNTQQQQQQAIDAIQQSPQFSALVQQGEQGILGNAAATGGLRGGNVQGALAQFRPAMLQQLIESQYQKLGGLAQQGQASAAGVGAAGQQTGVNIANLLGQQGQAQAAGALARGQAQSNLYGSVAQAGGLLAGRYLGDDTSKQQETF